MEMRIRSNTNIAMVFICFIVMFALSACASDNSIENAISNGNKDEALSSDCDKNINCEIDIFCYANYADSYAESEYGNHEETIRISLWEIIEREPDLSADDINRFDYQPTLDFLRQYTTIFFGYVFDSVVLEEAPEDFSRIWTNDGTFQRNDIISVSIDVWHESRRGQSRIAHFVYDYKGNRITDAPFVRGSGVYYAIAFSFRLYVLNDDRTPLIIVRYGVPESCAIGFIVYKFIDGKYREIYSLDERRFLRNHQGEIFAYMHGDWTGEETWYSVKIFDDGMRIERLDDEHVPEYETLMWLSPLTALEEHITNIIMGN